jgi:transketolase
LFSKVMHINPESPMDPNNDRFVLSKGHAAPVLYAALCEIGIVPAEELKNVRKITSYLEGHPTPKIPFVDVATGSLGQGLSAAAGMAYVGKYIDCTDSNEPGYRVFCLMGDGESAEGSVWEAMSFASHYKLHNLCAIIDVNRLGQSEATMFQHNTDVYKARAEAFGFSTHVVDGHNVEELMTAFHNMCSSEDGRPTCIVARTFKGHDFVDIEDKDGWHGKAILAGGDAINEKVLNHLKDKLKAFGAGDEGDSSKTVPPLPESKHLVDRRQCVGGDEVMKLSEPPNYAKTDQVATRLAYGNALLKLGKGNSRVIGLDGDTKNSTFSIKLRDALPHQFIECFIAEQNMIGVGVGAACRGRTVPFVSTFACFFSRGFDQIRMAAISQSHCNFVGSHAGVSIGEDGPSQMALEDLAMFRSIPGSVVFYPTDAVSTERAVELAANQPSICFIRTGRPNAPIIYPNEEHFEIGKAKVLRQSDNDILTVVAAGVTLIETLKAVDQLKEEGVHVRVIDPFTIKPIDQGTLLQAAKETHGRFITVEDHYYQGGIGEAVLSALAEESGTTVKMIAIDRVPFSGKPEELLSVFGIDAEHILKAIKSFQ